MINIDISKYSNSVLKNIDKDNIMSIASFLSSHGCDFIEELIEDYFDLFTIQYDEFVSIFNKLNIKYNNNLINKVREDMNILEEFYI